MKKHEIVFQSEDESWNRTVEEMEDEELEKELDIEKLKAIERAYKNLKLLFLREELKRIKDTTNKPKAP